MEWLWIIIFLIIVIVLALLIQTTVKVYQGGKEKAKKAKSDKKKSDDDKESDSEKEQLTAVEPAESVSHAEHKKESKHEGVTWETYDWSKHDKKFYDAKTGDVSHGVIAFSDDGKKIMLSQNQKGMWGFYRDHQEDSDKSGFEAAIRKFKEETGIAIPASAKVLDELTEEKEIEFEEHRLNKHIQHQMDVGKRPHWNKPGPVKKKNMFYIVKIAADKPKPKEGRVVEWIAVDEAVDKVSQSGSNQGPLLEDAIKSLKKKGKYELPDL